jgi:nicotinamidase-related amidase
MTVMSRCDAVEWASPQVRESERLLWQELCRQQSSDRALHSSLEPTVRSKGGVREKPLPARCTNPLTP